MNLKELSEILGLSQTTVSRALNGYPEVSARTRDRVERAAKEHNYVPSTRAKALATGKAFAIGHVLPVSSRQEMVNPIFGDFLAGAGETYAARGYEMLLSTTADASELDVYRSFSARRSVDGVIIHGPRIDDARIPLLEELHLPFAVHGRVSGWDSPYTWLDVNNRAAFATATRHLIGLGHRRIALLNGAEEYDFGLRRRDGYRLALAEAGLSEDDSICCQGEMTEAYGYTAAQEALDRPDPPTAVLCSSIMTALGVRRALDSRGLVMGRDVSIVTFDDVLSYLRNEGAEAAIFTAMRSSVRAAGVRLAEMLIDSIECPGRAPETELLEAELVEGGSTGPGPAA